MLKHKTISEGVSAPPSRRKATLMLALGGYVNTGILVVQGLILVPLYLYHIGAHTYGLWLASGGILGMLGLMNFGISIMLVQRVASAYGKQDYTLAGAYFFNGMIVYLFICLLFGGVGWGISAWVPSVLKVTSDEADLLQNCFQVAVVAMTVAILNECLRSFSQALLRPVVPMAGMAIGRIIGICVTVWMLFDEFGLWAIPMGTLAAELVILIVNLFNSANLFRGLAIKMTLDQKIIKEYVKASPVLLMATTGNTVSQEAEPLLITMLLSPEITTAYMITRRAADIVFRMLSVVVGSTMGTFSHLVGSGDNEKTKGVVKKLLIVSFSLGAIGFASYVGANHIFVSLWVGELFALEQNIILFIAFGFFARTLRGLIGQMLYGLGDFTFTSIVIFIEGLVRILLAIGLLSFFGVLGIPLAFSFSCFVAMLVLGFRLRKKLMMYFCFPAMARPLFSGIMIFSISVISSQVPVNIDSWLVFTLYAFLFLIFILTIYVLMNWKVVVEFYRNIKI
jgi:Na+-driven multidrug efflux pump